MTEDLCRESVFISQYLQETDNESYNTSSRSVIKLFNAVACALLLCACTSPPVQKHPSPVAKYSVTEKKGVTIALLGASGMVGGFVLQEALTQGYNIRALVRTPQKLNALKDQITIVQGDALDRAAIDALLAGSDVVISALGPVKADGEAALMVSTTASGHVIESMLEHSIQRYIVVSGGAVTVPGDDRNMTGWLLQQAASLTLRSTLQDKQAEYELLADSSSQWTLVRCPIIDPEPFEQHAAASLETPTSFRLRAGELARFIVDQISSDEFVGEAPFLSSR